MAVDVDIWTTLELVRSKLEDVNGSNGVNDKIDELVAVGNVPTPDDIVEWVIRPDNDDAALTPSCSVTLREPSESVDEATPHREELVPILVEVVAKNNDRGTCYEHCLVYCRAVDMVLTKHVLSADAAGNGVYHVDVEERTVRPAEVGDRNRWVAVVEATARVRTQRSE